MWNEDLFAASDALRRIYSPGRTEGRVEEPRTKPWDDPEMVEWVDRFTQPEVQTEWERDIRSAAMELGWQVGFLRQHAVNLTRDGVSVEIRRDPGRVSGQLVRETIR